MGIKVNDDQLYFFLEIDGMHVWSDGTVLDYARGHFNRYPTGHPDKVYTSEDCVEEVTRVFFPLD